MAKDSGFLPGMVELQASEIDELTLRDRMALAIAPVMVAAFIAAAVPDEAGTLRALPRAVWDMVDLIMTERA